MKQVGLRVRHRAQGCEFAAARHLPVVVFLLALVARLLAILVVDVVMDMPAAGFARSASGEFADLAENLVAGRGFTIFQVHGEWVPSAYMPPTYPFILAGVFAALGQTATAFVAVQVFQAVLGATASVLVFLIARHLFGSPTGLVAGLLYACGYPVLLYSAAEIHTVTLYVLLNCLVVYLLLRLTEPQQQALHPAWAWLAGAVMGFVALSTAEALVYLLLLVIWLLLTCPLRRALRITLPFGAAAILVLMPWTIRNYLVFERLVPVRAWGGFNLWRGQNEFAVGSGHAPVPGGLVWQTPGISAQIAALPWSRDWEARVDDIYLDEALTFMRQRPVRSLGLVPNKLFYYWVVDVHHSLARHPLYWLPWALYGLLFALGVVLSLGLRSKPWILYLYIMAGSVLASIFFVLPRYRLFIEPFVIMFAAYGLWRGLSFLGSRHIAPAQAIVRFLESLTNHAYAECS